jgi:hypothetical protein
MTFNAVESGLLRRGSARLGWRMPDLQTGSRILIFAGVAFVPPALLAAFEGRLWGAGSVFSRDVAVLVRFLWVGPLLIALEALIGRELGASVSRWRTGGLVPPDRQLAFDRTLMRLQRLQHSTWAALLMLVAAGALAWVDLHNRASTAPRLWVFDRGAPASLSLAGWWYAGLSVPLLYVYLLRWLWRLGLWNLLLIRLARLPPRVVGMHPDRRGGLDSVARAHNLFAGLLLALSSLAAAALANHMLHGGMSIDAAKGPAAVFVAAGLVLFLAPLGLFTPLLLELRRRSAALYGEMAARHTADLEAITRRILAGGPHNPERVPDNILENQANLTQSFDSLREMRSSLLTLDALKLFGLAAVLPFLLAALVKVPASELFDKLGKLAL